MGVYGTPPKSDGFRFGTVNRPPLRVLYTHHKETPNLETYLQNMTRRNITSETRTERKGTRKISPPHSPALRRPPHGLPRHRWAPKSGRPAPARMMLSGCGFSSVPRHVGGSTTRCAPQIVWLPHRDMRGRHRRGSCAAIPSVGPFPCASMCMPTGLASAILRVCLCRMWLLT